MISGNSPFPQRKPIIRVSVSAANADQKGFDLSFNSWGNTVVWGASATWFAFEKTFSTSNYHFSVN
jgi:hypothetical protein